LIFYKSQFASNGAIWLAPYVARKKYAAPGSPQQPYTVLTNSPRPSKSSNLHNPPEDLRFQESSNEAHHAAGTHNLHPHATLSHITTNPCVTTTLQNPAPTTSALRPESSAIRADSDPPKPFNVCGRNHSFCPTLFTSPAKYPLPERPLPTPPLSQNCHLGCTFRGPRCKFWNNRVI
jgi:hypothetical protein